MDGTGTVALRFRFCRRAGGSSEMWKPSRVAGGGYKLHSARTILPAFYARPLVQSVVKGEGDQSLGSEGPGPAAGARRKGTWTTKHVEDNTLIVQFLGRVWKKEGSLRMEQPRENYRLKKMNDNGSCLGNESGRKKSPVSATICREEIRVLLGGLQEGIRQATGRLR